jgi:hypothetical protein
MDFKIIARGSNNRKKIKIPERTEDQKRVARAKCGNFKIQKRENLYLYLNS